MGMIRQLFATVLLATLSGSVYAACDSTLPLQGAREDILIIVNDNSLDSCEVGRYYAEKRGLGQSNIVHVATRPQHLLDGAKFRNLMDQIIKYMQDNTLQAGAPSAPVCTGAEGPYYCQASMDHLRQFTRIRYIVTTRGVPFRAPITGTTFKGSGSIDNYLSYWLVRYFPSDVPLNFDEREKAFGDGRGMRPIDPSFDGELIVGRLDAADLVSTKALIDRIIKAEENGIFGKLYGSRFGAHARYAQWLNFQDNSLVYGTSPLPVNGGSWRYQFGLFGEDRTECIDYLNSNAGTAAGRAPQHCTVRFSETPPGRASSRTPVVDDALVYLGKLHGQISGGGSFDTVLNWVKNDSCSVKLCENAADPAACRAASTDVKKEINTACVGVADGFMGFNYQSFPVAFNAIWPTGYRGENSGGTNTNIVAPVVRDTEGQDDNFSLWFTNTETIADPKCYSGTDFTSPPTIGCRQGYAFGFYPQVVTGGQVVDANNPQQYRIGLWYKAQNITDTANLTVRFRVYEPNNPAPESRDRWLSYGNFTLDTVPLGDTDWTYSETIIQLDPSLHVDPALVYDKIEVYIGSGTYLGEIGLDNISIKELKSNTEYVQNQSFSDGHKEVSGGDHAATYLARLNGVAFWGSMSHYQSGGHSFGNHAQETLLYFQRGLPLGDAVWWGEKLNSGMLYGDPVYSPIAVRLDYKNNYDFVSGSVDLKGSAVNGRDPGKVTTSYSVEYCQGDDFYICDQSASWQNTGVSGNGGQENMSLGTWDATSLSPGKYVLRLSVTSDNASLGRNQTFYDYYPVTVYDDVSDHDGDGLTDKIEVTVLSTDPENTDTDGDGASDGNEVNILGTDPLNADSDGDGMPDGWEASAGTNPLADDSGADLDGDGLTNLEEFTAGTAANNIDTDGDGLTDDVEINTYGSDPTNTDSDNDGLTDGEEVNTYFTNPTNSDTDQDGIADGIEIANGTDPLQPSLESWAGTITGRITTADGIGVAGVTFWDVSRYPETVTTDENGYFVIRGYSGGESVWLNMNGTGSGYSFAAAGNGGIFVHSGGAEVARNYIATPKSDTVRGRVTLANGEPLSDITFWNILNYPDTFTTNTDGQFVSQGQSQGDTVWFNTYNSNSAGYTLSTLGWSGGLFQHDGTAMSGYDYIATQNPGTISGRITTPDGKPLAGVGFWDVSKYPATITTNADGRFVSQSYSAGDFVWFNTFAAGVTLVPSGWDGSTFQHDGTAMTGYDFIAVPN